MVTALVFPASLYDRLLAHVGPSGVEQVAFMLTRGTGTDLEVIAVLPAAPSWFETQTGYHVSLKDEVRGQMIKRAWDEGAGLAEAHSHIGAMRASFSPTDIAGLQEWAPHVRWRLAGRPYVALVFAGATFDALAWSSEFPAPIGIDEVRVDDGRQLAPTGLTARALGGERSDG